jgi:hypothetical protein
MASKQMEVQLKMQRNSSSINHNSLPLGFTSWPERED